MNWTVGSDGPTRMSTKLAGACLDLSTKRATEGAEGEVGGGRLDGFKGRPEAQTDNLVRPNPSRTTQLEHAMRPPKLPTAQHSGIKTHWWGEGAAHHIGTMGPPSFCTAQYLGTRFPLISRTVKLLGMVGPPDL